MLLSGKLGKAVVPSRCFGLQTPQSLGHRIDWDEEAWSQIAGEHLVANLSSSPKVCGFFFGKVATATFAEAT